MDSFQISLNGLIELYRFMSIGKLVNGLIHNLNGPLHSLGIEMDVMNHLVLKKTESRQELIENIKARLTRMDDEFENLNLLIRMAAARLDLAEYCSHQLDINTFVQQELEFLRANLFFKHHVKTTLQLDKTLTTLRGLPERLAEGFAWFIHGLVEEMERQKLQTLTVMTTLGESTPVVQFTLEGGGLSERTKLLLETDPSSFDNFRVENLDLGMLLGVVLLKSNGASIEPVYKLAASEITVTIRNPLS